MTLEEAQKKILELETNNEELIKNNESLTTEIENLKTENETTKQEAEKTINQLKEHNSFLFQRVSQSNKIENKEIDNVKSSEESLEDLLIKLGR